MSKRVAVLIGGAGDTGRRLGEALSSAGWEVVTTSRREGAGTIRWDPTEQGPLRANLSERVGQEDTLAFVNLIGGWLRDPRAVIVGGASASLGEIAALDRARPPRYVHCSATTVYGDRPGELLSAAVSQTSPALEIARAQLEAEELVMGSELVDGVTLRLPHIYGPGRERTLEWSARGVFPVVGGGQNWMHHVHVDDLVDALVAAVERDEASGQILDVVDDGGPYADYVDHAARAWGSPRPRRLGLEEAREAGFFTFALGRHFGADQVLEEFYANMECDARIDPAPAREVLGLEPRYASFAAGLDAILGASRRAQMDGERAARALSARVARALDAALDERELDAALATRAASAQALGDVTLRTRAWGAARGVFVRVAVIVDPRFAMVSVLGLPPVDARAPALQIDWVARGDGLVSALCDVFPLGGDEDAPSARELLSGPAWRASFRAPVLSPGAVMASRGPLREETVDEVGELVDAWLERLGGLDGASASAPAQARADALDALLTAHRSRGNAFLERTFGRGWATRYVDEVFFPAPQVPAS